MSATFVFTGLDELKAQLRQLPAELAAEGGHLVEARGNRATHTIKAGYPSRAGDLRAKTEVTHTKTRFGARSVIRSASTHAALFESGSQTVRVTSTGISRGRMPANHLFTQTMMRERRALDGDFVDLLTRNGLTVTGHG